MDINIDVHQNISETSTSHEISNKSSDIGQQMGDNDAASNKDGMPNNNLENQINCNNQKVVEKECAQLKTVDESQEKNACEVNIDNKSSQDINENASETKEQQEDDIPESFFDDLMSEDFIEGLNVVDTWEGDDTVKCKTTIEDPIQKANETEKCSSRSSKERHKDKKKKSRKNKKEHKSRNIHSSSEDKDHRSRRSGSNRSRSYRFVDGNSRRDPTKTQRDILRDKDKCEKDKTTKILHEKLKVVETGLVPPGMEMEVDVQSANKPNRFEEGEVVEQESTADKRLKSIERKKDIQISKADQSRCSPRKENTIRRKYSPEYRREYRRRSRSRSGRRRYSSRDRSRSRSIERRIGRRRTPRRSRSRSMDFLDKYRYRSPLRKASPLIKRNQELFKQIDLLKSKLYSNDTSTKLQSSAPRNIEHELPQSKIPPTIHANIPNMNMPQNFINNPVQYPPVPNLNFIPLQPVPPPQQTHIELDQQFFIGQPSMEPNPYAVPMQQSPMLHNPVQPPPPEMQHNFQPNWHMEQPQPEPIHFFNANNQFVMEQNSYQTPVGPPMGFMQNPVNMPLQEQQLSVPFSVQENSELISFEQPIDNKQKEEDIFAKLFADNKITLSDYLSVTAKATDNSNPVDIQNKIKVISHCQEALHEINENVRTTGKFLPQKSQKSFNRPPNGEGLSPFKKVPVIKFQYTTYSKQAEEKPQLTASLNRLMCKLGKDISFEEVHRAPSTPSRSDHKESQKNKWTSHVSVQTDAVSTSDFGCQVNFEDIPSPTKGILKKQSLANMTPAQLLAQAEKEASPPPAPRWTPPSDVQLNWRKVGKDVYRNTDDVDRRNLHASSNAGWSIPSRNSINTPAPSSFDRSLTNLQHLLFSNRH